MKLSIDKSSDRGVSDLGWLKSFHTFSFGNYFNPGQTNFGVLRVINDDTVSPGGGFGTHPHKDMEIISIPLAGSLAHKDSMGNSGTISVGEVQVMSAGNGVQHSEKNASDEIPVAFLQLWIFPNKKGVSPRYGQAQIEVESSRNKWNLIVGPKNSESKLWIHQDAYLHLSKFDAGEKVTYTLENKSNGVYLFIIKGSVSVLDTSLHERDGIGIEDIEKLDLTITEQTELLLMEVPMTLG